MKTKHFPFNLLIPLIVLLGCNQSNTTKINNTQSLCDIRKEVARTFIEEAFNNKNISILDNMYSDSLSGHFQNWHGKLSREYLKKGYQSWLEAFPDFNFTLYQVICEGDYVAINCSFTGTHQKKFKGIEPLNNKVNILDAIFLKFDENNRIIEITEIWDDGRMKEMMAKKPE